MSLPAVLCEENEECGIPFSLLQLLNQHFKVVSTSEFEQNPSTFADLIIAVVVFNGRPKITVDLLKILPNIKIIANCGAGYNHIDVKMVKSFGGKVSNTPGVLDDSVADMALLLLMAAGRNLLKYISIAKTNPGWFPINNVTNSDIHNSTLGIVGMGNIGYKIAQRANAFNMNVLYHNRTRRNADVENSVRASYYSKLEDMLPLCDFLMIAVCVTPSTTKMFGKNEFLLMKSTSVLINISRGVVVDQDALVEALKLGEIRFAALDVTNPEPLPPDHALLKMKNVLVTSHCGSATAPTRVKMMQLVIDNILATINGVALPSEVTE